MPDVFMDLKYGVRLAFSVVCLSVSLGLSLPLLAQIDLEVDPVTGEVGDEVITEWTFTVDFGDETYREEGNAWRTWPFGPAVGGSYRYLSHYDEGRPRVGSAYWGAQMPVTGRYEVLVSFRATENRSRDANYHLFIDKAAPLASFDIDQHAVPTKNTLTWVSLGEYVWDKDQQVVVQLDGTDDNESDEADAVRWVLLENLESSPVNTGKANLLPPLYLLLSD